uniref:F-box domain-containing protein n=1 Tax=Panagrolaimus sp. JU765 TaxID=591449 RepID=A0AC34QM73_9BILA
MEYFDFLGLPEVVQDLIVHEIVHNSVPNDRIQLAGTCKYMNEAVKRAKPKKIVEKLQINWWLDILTFSFDSRTLYSSPPLPEFFTSICQILQQIQAENLIVGALVIDEAQQLLELSDLFYYLFEATKFITELYIHHSTILQEFTELYNKLEHVEFMYFSHSSEMFNSLSHYPSRMRLNFEEHYDSSILENITKKTENNPLTLLRFDDSIPVEDLQRFLQTTKFKNDCEIYCKSQNPKGETIHIFLTFMDDEQGFEIETFPTESSLINANQKFDGKKKRMLTLSVVEQKTFGWYYDDPSWSVPFNVTMKTQPTEPLIDDCLTDDSFESGSKEKDYVLENVEENNWIKINFDDDNAYVHYSNQMLESNFPRNDYLSALERLGDINNVLGCKITTIKPEMLCETIENLENGRIYLPDVVANNFRIQIILSD